MSAALIFGILFAVALAALVVTVAGDQHLAAENRRLRRQLRAVQVENTHLRRELIIAKSVGTGRRRPIIAGRVQS